MQFSLASGFSLARSRICSSRLTIAYFALSCLYCVLQTAIAVQGWAVNQHAGDVIKTIFQQSNITLDSYAHLESSTGTLHLCQNNTDSVRPAECPIIWPIPEAVPTTVNGNKVARRSMEVMKNLTESGNLAGLTIIGIGDLYKPSTDEQAVVHATLVCIQAMQWPLQHLLNQKREDICFIAFQIWVMGMSCVAIFHESIPHVWATFITHLIAALWSAFQLWSTHAFKANYSKLIMGVDDHTGYLGLLGGGACAGQDMLPAYFNPRIDVELAIAILNFISVFTSGYLAYRLVYVFGWNTFKHIGASVIIHRVYKLVLTLSILIQLSLFYIVASVGVWIDQLYNGYFGRYASLLEIYKAWGIVILVALIPWLTLGWFSVRREWRRGLLVFNGLSAFFLLSWLAVIFSGSWRLTFLNWRFFSIIQVGAFASCLLTLVFGLLCRIFCFERGLPHYLNRPTDATVGAQWDTDTEKVEFPDFRDAMPQFIKPPPAILPPYESDSRTRHNPFHAAPVEHGPDSAQSLQRAVSGSMTSYAQRTLDGWESRGAPHDRRSSKEWVSNFAFRRHMR